MDAAIYNCVLDVCMSNGATQQAETIFQDLPSQVLTARSTVPSAGDAAEEACHIGHVQHARPPANSSSISRTLNPSLERVPLLRLMKGYATKAG